MKMKKFWFFIFLFFAGVIIALLVFLLTQRPKYSGNIRLNKLSSEVTCYFDSYGIPHIYGKNEEDVYRTLGYLQAQDRLLQMDLVRRASSGRLSEIFGKQTVDIDKFFRMLGISQHAEWSAEEFMKHPDEPWVKNALTFLDGVNDYIINGRQRLECTMLGIPREKYTLKDLFLIVDYMSFNFQLAFRTDHLYSKIEKQWGNNYLYDFGVQTDTVSFISDSAVIRSSIITMNKLDSVFDQLPFKIWSGSNSWAISSARSVSSKVLFENDTHIGIQQPAVWYEAYLECPGLNLYGSFLAGFPFAPIGHTLNHAWGLTILENDDLDFFEEHISATDSTEYLYKGEWLKMKFRNETIHVKDTTDVILNCRSTIHGPVCSDVILEWKGATPLPVSVCWTFLKFPNNLIEVSYRFSKAENMSEFRHAVSMIAAPGLNIIYGDDQDNIAWYAAAKFVERRPGANPHLLQDGSGVDDWMGYMDFTRNPKAENPLIGFVFSANTHPQPDSGVIFPGYYVPEDRAIRINQMIWEKKKFTLEDIQRMNTDVKNPVAAGVAQSMLSALPGTAMLKSQIHERASRILHNWAGDHRLKDVAPVIYYKWLFHTLYYSYEDELGEADFYALLNTYDQKRTLKSFMKNTDSPWWDDQRTKEKESRKDILEKAYFQTIDELIEQLGPDADKWTWEKVHMIEFEHPIGKQKPLDKIFNIGPYPIIGGMETVNNQSFNLNGSGIYKVNLGPALRRTIDLHQPENAYSINPSGQSGNILSSHYDDQAKMYIKGHFRKELMNKAEILKVCKDKLTFRPGL
jgi:penicillin G amidase